MKTVTFTTHTLNGDGSLYEVYFNNVTSHSPDYVNFWYEIHNDKGKHRIRVTDILAVVESTNG
jgi:hypothetical protein